MIKYRAKYGAWRSDQISAVEVQKETENSVFIDGRRSAKRSGYESFFDTWDEAKEHLIVSAKQELESAQRQLDYVRSGLQKIQSMKNPAT